MRRDADRRNESSHNVSLLLIGFLFVIFSFPGQAADWDWEVAPYAWAVGVSGDGNGGDISFDLDLDTPDIINLLDGAALIHAQVRNGKSAFFGDLMYLALEPEKTQSRLGNPIDADLDALIFSLSYARQFAASEESLHEWTFGARYLGFDISLETSLLPTYNGSSSWLDATVGYRFHRDLSSDWAFTFLGDIGAGESNRSYQLLGLLSRQFKSRNRLTFGYRAMGLDLTGSRSAGLLRPLELDVIIHGLMVGYIFD